MEYDDILQIREKNISLADIIDEDILNRLKEEFKGYSINPIHIVFSLEKEDIVEGNLVMAHVKQEHTKEKICTFDVNEPEFLDKFVKCIKKD